VQAGGIQDYDFRKVRQRLRQGLAERLGKMGLNGLREARKDGMEKARTQGLDALEKGFRRGLHIRKEGISLAAFLHRLGLAEKTGLEQAEPHLQQRIQGPLSLPFRVSDQLEDFLAHFFCEMGPQGLKVLCGRNMGRQSPM
jgi:hypothetical protein